MRIYNVKGYDVMMHATTLAVRNMSYVHIYNT